MLHSFSPGGTKIYLEVGQRHRAGEHEARGRERDRRGLGREQERDPDAHPEIQTVFLQFLVFSYRKGFVKFYLFSKKKTIDFKFKRNSMQF